MSTQEETNDQQRPGENSDTPEAKTSSRRLFLLIGLLALALFALWYDYKVARPAVEQAYERIAAKNDDINTNAEQHRMTNADVQGALGRTPSETFLNGKYTIEAYRWSAGMPIELRGLNGDDSPGIGLKTHDYYAVYRKDGPQLSFVTHFKFDLDNEYFVEKVAVASSNDSDSGEDMMQAMGGGGGPPGGGGPGGGGPGGGGGFDPEAFFAERDADADGKLAGEEISERMQARMDTIDTDGDGAVSKEEFLAGMSRRGGGGGPGGESDGAGRRQRPPLEESDDAPAAEAASSDDAPTADSKEVPADTTTEESTTEPAPEAAAKTSEEATKDESNGES
jgi:hypothetical protein